jgi:8-oxo-dGTP pyrophosphatase MutT (NUDIX family)
VSELVDILSPPDFKKSGVVKPRNLAWEDGDWIGSFNLWIVQDKPEPVIVYQQRSLNSRWEPGKLDITAGGAYKAGEELVDGLREVKEEVGKTYEYDDLTFLGRKLNLSPNVQGIMCHYVAHVFITLDNSPLGSYVLESNEVVALYLCPIDKLLKVPPK